MQTKISLFVGLIVIMTANSIIIEHIDFADNTMTVRCWNHNGLDWILPYGFPCVRIASVNERVQATNLFTVILDIMRTFVMFRLMFEESCREYLTGAFR